MGNKASTLNFITTRLPEQVLYSIDIDATSKKESVLNRVPRVPACYACQRAYVLCVPACQRALACQRASVPSCFGVPTCQRANVPWRAYVPACLRAIEIFACHQNFGVPSKFRRAIKISACHQILRVQIFFFISSWILLRLSMPG